MKRSGTCLLTIGACWALLALQAPPQLDCGAYADYAGAEPAGYATQCLGISPPAKAPATRPAPRLPTDTAIAHDIGFVSDNFVHHFVGDLSAQITAGTSAESIFAYDFDREGDTLYAIRNPDNAFGTSINGTFSPIGTLTAVPEHGAGATWSGLGIDPIDGTVYAISLGGSTTALYTIDPTTATATPLFQVASHTLVIDITVDCNGEIYAHDIATDTLLRFDLASQRLQTIGLTGLDSNFAQGMDFDNSDGKLYMYTYQGGGANVYGTANLATGAVTAINSSDPQGEFEGAIPTRCPLLDFFIGDE